MGIDPQRQAARALAISGIVRDGVALSARDAADLVDFLSSLTDIEALDLSAAKPLQVPSELPAGGMSGRRGTAALRARGGA